MSTKVKIENKSNRNRAFKGKEQMVVVERGKTKEFELYEKMSADKARELKDAKVIVTGEGVEKASAKSEPEAQKTDEKKG